jgi:hypothetical protein
MNPGVHGLSGIDKPFVSQIYPSGHKTGAFIVLFGQI